MVEGGACLGRGLSLTLNQVSLIKGYGISKSLFLPWVSNQMKNGSLIPKVKIKFQVYIFH